MKEHTFFERGAILEERIPDFFGMQTPMKKSFSRLGKSR